MKRLVLSAVVGLSLASANNMLSKNSFETLVKSNNPDYCLTKNKYFVLKVKNDFGDFVTKKYIASNAVLAAKNANEKIEFNKDLNRIYLIATILKNSNDIFKNFFKPNDKDDEIFSLSVFLSSWLKYGGMYGYIPLTELNLENLQTKKVKFLKRASTVQIANGLINYLSNSNNRDELNKRILLLSAYLLAATDKDITINFDKDNFLRLTDENRGHDFLTFFMRTILENTKNPKIQNLIYLLATKNKNIVKYMLHDKNTKQLFKKALEFYKKAKRC